MERIIGLDLGASQSSVAMLVDGQPVLVPDEQGRVAMPSVVAFPENADPLVGFEARRWRLTDPSRAVTSIRRLMGRDADDAVVRHVASLVAYPIAAGPSGKAAVALGESLHGPSEVSAPVFRALKDRVDAYTRDNVKKCVLVVPAHMGDSARLAMRLGAQMGGLETVRLVNAPTAVALRYAQLKNQPMQRILVVCAGAGGADAAVVDLAPGSVRVLAATGDARLGSDSVDRPLFERLRDRFRQLHGIDLAEDLVASARLWGAAENAKSHLADNPSVEVRLREMAYTDNGSIDLVDEVERKDLQSGLVDLSRRLNALADDALGAAGVPAAGIDALVVSGGLTRIPAIVDGLTRQFRAPAALDVQHDGAPAEGAALYGHLLLGRNRPQDVLSICVVDVALHALTLDVGDKRTRILPRQIALPAAVTRTFTTAGDDQSSIAFKVRQSDGVGPSALVGELVVDGLLAAPAGKVKVDVTLEVDTDGVVTVAATDVGSGKRTAVPVRLGLEALEQEVVALRLRRGEVRV